MFYIKWNSNLYDYSYGIDRKSPYLINLNTTYWGALKDAKGFASIDDAKLCIQKLDTRWLHLTTFIFIHPLNFKERCLRDV